MHLTPRVAASRCPSIHPAGPLLAEATAMAMAMAAPAVALHASARPGGGGTRRSLQGTRRWVGIPSASSAAAAGWGLHSSTCQLNLSALYRTGGARRGCVARVKGV